MTFKTFVLPGVRAFSSSMRVKLSREPAFAGRAPFSTPVSDVKPAHRQVHWRVSPATGQLEQRWSTTETQDPQSRGFSSRASRSFSLYATARAE
ncbi:hypothetical protein BOH74_17810 [Pseudomonas versuta]|uniref:Uncharacterized protein n=1 Tax=Pseudomonas versuta TaxID=1788301 RepID=A0A853ZMJ9_9PSED|nr:hypothetical protein [Pseudomonas versuta]OKA19466.1 hypothetical protein BOH74_17810 [Pseudomonas versuta]